MAQDATSGGGMVSPGTQQAHDLMNATNDRLQESREKVTGLLVFILISFWA